MVDGEGWTPENGYTISLPCEPNGSGGSGELKTCLGCFRHGSTQTGLYNHRS